MTLLVYMAYRWSFQRSFDAYVDSSQNQVLVSIKMTLEEHYSVYRSWQWFASAPDNWEKLVSIRFKSIRAGRPMVNLDQSQAVEASNVAARMISRIPSIENTVLLLDAERFVPGRTVPIERNINSCPAKGWQSGGLFVLSSAQGFTQHR